jgi:hypothetical protein
MWKEFFHSHDILDIVYRSGGGLVAALLVFLSSFLSHD